MRLFLFFFLLLTSPAVLQAQNAADSIDVRDAALDYIEGWYGGDAERMERAVHRELAKRIIRTDPQSGRSELQQMGATQLVGSTRRGGGSRTPLEEQRTDVAILDVYHDVASVRVDAGDWIDYLHLAKADGRWQIINVLWVVRPRTD